MSKSVLIVGGCGYIGGYLTDILKSDYHVTVYDNLLYETRFLKNVKFIKGDIRDSKKLESIIHDYDVVVWLAAVVGDGACQADPFIAKHVNEDSVRVLDNYKGKIIFSSTCSVYGINHDLLDELAPVNPLSVYAETKLAAERYLLEKHAERVLVYRLGTLFGVGDEHSRIRLDLVTNILAARAAKQEPLKVYGGQQWRPIIHVKSVGEAIKFGIDQNINGLYNLSDINLTIKSMAQKVQEVIPNVKIEYTDLKFEDLRNYMVDNRKILDTGWECNHSIYEGILDVKKLVDEERIVNWSDPVYSNEAYLKGRYGL